MLIELNALQRNAIEEVINIGLGRAAVSLSEIASDEIMLIASDAHLSNINTGQALDLIKKPSPGNMVSIAQNLEGDVNASALVIFSEADAIEIVRHMLAAQDAEEFCAEYEYEVMSEVGNMILNACISALANMMQLSVESFLPVHHSGECEEVVLDNPLMPLKILMQLDLIIEKQVFKGFVSFSMNAKSLKNMTAHIERYIESQELV